MKKKAEPSLTKLADEAFEQAALEVIELAKRTGTPVIVWQDGATKAVSPYRFRLPRTRNRSGRTK